MKDFFKNGIECNTSSLIGSNCFNCDFNTLDPPIGCNLKQYHKSIVFDLDGTLVDTSRDLINAANESLNELGFDKYINPESDKLTAFRGGRALLTLGLKRANHDHNEDFISSHYQTFLNHYDKALDIYSELYPNVLETLDQLVKAEWVLGICTNKPERMARILLDSLGVLGKFSCITGADTYPFRKPEPKALTKTIEGCNGSIEHSIMVGDTITDFQTAKRAEVPVILVGFGPTGSDYETLDPDGVLMNYEQLPELASTIIQR